MNISKIYYPSKSEILPSKKMYYLRAGFYGKENTFNKNMRNILNEIYIEAMELAESVLYYKTLKLSDLKKFEIPEKFGEVKTLTYFASTIGKKIDEKIDFYQQTGEILKASLLDAWGSESIEEVNNCFDKNLRIKHGNGTMRFSPGYGDISLLENMKIIKLLDAEGLETHSKSGVLIPQKSTVCMIGWY